MRRHKIKVEKPVASTSQTREQEHDLAYYIHDRVELMHQVFSVLKYKELKAMAPECVRHISIGDLQELCTEELLGISSKRLCAVLDGAEPPSDTESSSRSPSPPLETISLDSISSDEEILSESSKKKKHKHRHRSRSKKKKAKEPPESEEAERSRASRAGLTVLELLELQARARAIRAQLQQEQAHVAPAAAAGGAHTSASDNDVEIKEEPPDVVEISSDDDKHEARLAAPQTRQVVRQPVPQTDGKSVTKIGNDLIITTPAKSHRKIKLNRTKPTPPVPAEKPAPQPVEVDKSKSKKKKKDKKKTVDKEGSDNDEITLQLSDSEKMDLLGSLEQKAFEQPSTEDSESSSDSEGERGKKDKHAEKKVKEPPITDLTDTISEGDLRIVEEDGTENKTTPAQDTTVNITTNKKDTKVETAVCEKDRDTQKAPTDVPQDTKTDDVINPDENNDINKEKSVEEQIVKEVLDISSVEEIPLIESSQEDTSVPKETEKEVVPTTTKDKDKDKSEGEVSDRDSSEVEAFVAPPEVVCISDEDSRKKKKKKKDKKAKKEKKSKKSKPDFHDGSDQNFYPVKDTEVRGDSEATKEGTNISNQEEDVCVILELSDDSSCYEVEGTLLSKEPTAEEIEALSAKIDEIEREEVVTDEQIREHERMLREREGASDADNVSWKDRYLDSRKVKEVMSTSNILNAMRKKNKELKKKLEESKKTEEGVKQSNVEERVKQSLEEGSIEQYNTLQASMKLVNSVKEAEKIGELKTQEEDGKVSKEMKKDAKQLLKMYKKLLKYNDINKIRDPSKKKKKKRRKHDGVVA